MKEIESRYDIDQAVHNRISKMLYIGQNDNIDEEDPESYIDKAKHRNDNLLKHQEEIIAIKEAIKPGLFAIFCQSFDRDLIRNYFERLSLEDIDENVEQELLEQKIEREVNEEALLVQDKKVSTGVEEVRLSPATENTRKGREQLLKEEMRAKRDMQSTGVRKKMSLNNFDHLSRDLYDKANAKRNSPRGGQGGISFNNFTPAPDFDTKDEL